MTASHSTCSLSEQGNPVSAFTPRKGTRPTSAPGHAGRRSGCDHRVCSRSALIAKPAPSRQPAPVNPADAPLLLIAWRRPHTLRQVIGTIRPVAPTRLFVACDGPNPERPGEAEKVAATRTQ